MASSSNDPSLHFTVNPMSDFPFNPEATCFDPTLDWTNLLDEYQPPQEDLVQRIERLERYFAEVYCDYSNGSSKIKYLQQDVDTMEGWMRKMHALITLWPVRLSSGNENEVTCSQQVSNQQTDC
jgi:hypothetical protein